MDKVPQRVLVHELKRAIDLIPRDRLAVTRLRHLVAENPRASRSTHVLRNLGTERVRTLSDILGEPLAPRARVPVHHDADSYRQEARMATVDNHTFSPDQKKASPLCTLCKQPESSGVHHGKGISIKGTAKPDKLG